MECSERFWKLA